MVQMAGVDYGDAAGATCHEVSTVPTHCDFATLASMDRVVMASFL